MLAEQLTDPLAAHGEGPVWSEGWGGLRWVDLLAGDLLALDAGTGQVTRRHVATVLAALRPRSRGGAVLALERGFALMAADGRVEPLGDLWAAAAGLRMNDGACDPDGRFYCGSMAYDERARAGSLYRLDADGTARAVLTGTTVSNGLAWAPDGTTAYYVDSATGRVDAFDYDRETGLTGRRPVVTVPAAAGEPDGLTVDAEGNLWVALWGGGAVHGYAPDGRLAAVVPLPVPRVTACTFGGEHLGTLYVTTSRQRTDLERYPTAGALFAVDPGVTGRAAAPFLG